jgi:hypothetical protein
MTRMGLAVMTIAAILLSARNAGAVPSFSRQTQMPCDACHAAGFYPELNNFGRMFKMNGYVWSAHEEKPYEPIPPFAAVQSWSFTHTEADQPRMNQLPTVHFATHAGNDNFSYPQQANFFFAGRYYGRLGGFVMGTYSGVDNKWSTDNVDVRLSDVHSFDDHTLLYGGTFNNGPSVQDVWNTLPAWAQVIGSEVAPTPAASPSIANLGAQVAGVGAYGFWDNWLYGEVTPYVSAKSGPLSFITAGNTKETFVQGVAPYWRLVLYKNKDANSMSAGFVGLYDKAHQNGSHGSTNNFLDLGGDAQYQWNRKPDFITARTSLIWESQHLPAARFNGAASNHNDDVRTLQLWLSYYRYDLAGITVSAFDIDGSKDKAIYAPDPVDGSRTGNPRSWGGFVQLQYLPLSQWFHLKLPALPMTQFAIQYTFYGMFNGARRNYDGSGRHASDNNTLYLLAWTPW